MRITFRLERLLTYVFRYVVVVSFPPFLLPKLVPQKHTCTTYIVEALEGESALARK